MIYVRIYRHVTYVEGCNQSKKEKGRSTTRPCQPPTFLPPHPSTLCWPFAPCLSSIPPSSPIPDPRPYAELPVRCSIRPHPIVPSPPPAASFFQLYVPPSLSQMLVCSGTGAFRDTQGWFYMGSVSRLIAPPVHN